MFPVAQGSVCDLWYSMLCRLYLYVGLFCSVYYLPVKTMHLATSISRPNLISLGTCFGKFSKSGKFKLTITSLDWLAKYAKYKVSAFSRTGSPLGFGQSRKLNGNVGSGADMAEMNTARRST